LFLQALAGLAFYLVHSFIDFALIPDVMPLALVLHLGIVTPLALIALVLFWFNPPPALREFLVVGVGVLAGVITLGLMLLSDSPLRDQLATSTAAIMLFITVVQRARFPYAVASCVVLFIAHAVFLGL